MADQTEGVEPTGYLDDGEDDEPVTLLAVAQKQERHLATISLVLQAWFFLTLLGAVIGAIAYFGS